MHAHAQHATRAFASNGESVSTRVLGGGKVAYLYRRLLGLVLRILD